MTQRFIKYIPSELSESLMINHPNAFILFSYIVHHARWSANRTYVMLDGLLPGDCIMPGWEKLKFSSEKVYRNARDKLIELGFIEIVFNIHGKNQVKKRAIKRAIESMVVNICNSDIWDINIKPMEEVKGEPRANEGRYTKNVKNEEEVSFIEKETNKEKEEVVVSVPFPAIRKAEEEKLDEELETLGAYNEHHNLQISKKVLRTWLSKYGSDLVIDQIQQLIEKKELVHNQEAWIEGSLKARRRIQQNRDFIERFIAERHLHKNFSVHKSYCRDENTGNDYYYKLPTEEFQSAILRKYKQ